MGRSELESIVSQIMTRIYNRITNVDVYKNLYGDLNMIAEVIDQIMKNPPLLRGDEELDSRFGGNDVEVEGGRRTGFPLSRE